MSNVVELIISGMTCNHRVARDTKALEAVAGLESAAVTLEPGGAVVKGDADVEALTAAVREAGYTADAKG